MTLEPTEILRMHHLRETLPRRLVLKALQTIRVPMDPKEIHQWIRKSNSSVHLVTIYRVLGKFEQLDIVHTHPSSGKFTLCSLENASGHHGFLSCEQCGKVEEFLDERLCSEENRIAKKAGFKSKHHVSDIIGICISCQT